MMMKYMSTFLLLFRLENIDHSAWKIENLNLFSRTIDYQY